MRTDVKTGVSKYPSPKVSDLKKGQIGRLVTGSWVMRSFDLERLIWLQDGSISMVSGLNDSLLETVLDEGESITLTQRG